MGGAEISDNIKLGLVLVIMVFTLSAGMLVYNIASAPINNNIDYGQSKIAAADMETFLELCIANEVNGATVYTAMSQYGGELAGIVYENTNGNVTVYGGNVGSQGTLKDFLKVIETNGFDTMYHVFRSEPVDGIDYQPQTMFIGIREA